MKLIIFGSTGMLGRYISSYLKKQKLNVIDIKREDYDVMMNTMDDLEKLLVYHKIDKDTVVFNAIGMIPQRLNKQNEAMNNKMYIKINAIFPNILSQICKKYNAQMIHPSTDCVYSGKKGKYIETDNHDATSLYGITKSVGEPSDAIVIRVSIIGEEKYNKKSLLEWVRSNKDKEISGYADHYWNGITCLQYAKIVYYMISNNIYWSGVRHIVSPNNVSKYELTNIINKVYNLNIKINKMNTGNPCDKTLDTIHETNNLFNIPDLETQISELRNYKL